MIACDITVETVEYIVSIVLHKQRGRTTSQCYVRSSFVETSNRRDLVAEHVEDGAHLLGERRVAVAEAMPADGLEYLLVADKWGRHYWSNKNSKENNTNNNNNSNDSTKNNNNNNNNKSNDSTINNNNNSNMFGCRQMGSTLMRPLQKYLFLTD